MSSSSSPSAPSSFTSVCFLPLKPQPKCIPFSEFKFTIFCWTLYYPKSIFYDDTENRKTSCRLCLPINPNNNSLTFLNANLCFSAWLNNYHFVFLSNSKLQKRDLFEDADNHKTNVQTKSAWNPSKTAIYVWSQHSVLLAGPVVFQTRLVWWHWKIFHALALDLAYKIPAKTLPEPKASLILPRLA